MEVTEDLCLCFGSDYYCNENNEDNDTTEEQTKTKPDSSGKQWIDDTVRSYHHKTSGKSPRTAVRIDQHTTGSSPFSTFSTMPTIHEEITEKDMVDENDENSNEDEEEQKQEQQELLPTGVVDGV